MTKLTEQEKRNKIVFVAQRAKIGEDSALLYLIDEEWGDFSALHCALYDIERFGRRN